MHHALQGKITLHSCNRYPHLAGCNTLLLSEHSFLSFQNPLNRYLTVVKESYPLVIKEPFGRLTFIHLFSQATVDFAFSLIISPLFDYLPVHLTGTDILGDLIQLKFFLGQNAEQPLLHPWPTDRYWTQGMSLIKVTVENQLLQMQFWNQMKAIPC